MMSVLFSWGSLFVQQIQQVSAIGVFRQRLRQCPQLIAAYVPTPESYLFNAADFQALTLLHNTRAAVYSLEIALRQFSNALAVLLGRHAGSLRAEMGGTLAPQLVFADEPTGNLDSENSREVVELLLELQQEFNMTLLLATHSSEISDRADRVLSLLDGRLVDTGYRQ